MLKQKDIRNKILFVLLCMAILRFGAQLPIPMIDTTSLKAWFANSQFGGLSLINAFTGGALENFSVLALSVTPYITASILLQLLGVVFPKLGAMQKEEGDIGKTKFERITKYVTVGVAIISAVGLILTFSTRGLIELNAYNAIIAVLAMVAGSMFLIWLGDEITEKGVGNGVSIILMLSILSRIPGDFIKLYYQFIDPNPVWLKIVAGAVILLVTILTIVMVIILEDAKRIIPIANSKQKNGHILPRNANNSRFSLKVNIAGVIPVIFASTLLSFPMIVAGFFGKSDGWIGVFNQGNWFNPQNWLFTFGYLLYAVLVIAFAFFYVSITFNPVEIANNIRNQGSCIPGIRPGRPTAEYIAKIIKRLVPICAVWLLLIATVPIVFNGLFGASVSFGGTSIIIVVGVIIETFIQIDNMMTVRNYNGFLN